MARIDIGRVRHASSRDAEKDVGLHSLTGLHIEDESAAAIASWFQTPTGYGLTFAGLSSTGRADPQDLVDACDFELNSGHYDRNTMQALKALKHFAQSYQ